MVTEKEQEASQEFIEDNLMLISKYTIDLFLKENKKMFTDLIGLYMFYYYTAKWQKTNRCKATTEYTSKGTGLSKGRVREVKKILIKLGLISDIRGYGKDGKFSHWYIKIEHMYKQATISNILTKQTENSSHIQSFCDSGKNPPSFTTGGESQGVVDQETNAYSSNNKNAYNTSMLNIYKNIYSSSDSDESRSQKLSSAPFDNKVELNNQETQQSIIEKDQTHLPQEKDIPPIIDINNRILLLDKERSKSLIKGNIPSLYEKDKSQLSVNKIGFISNIGNKNQDTIISSDTNNYLLKDDINPVPNKEILQSIIDKNSPSFIKEDNSIISEEEQILLSINKIPQSIIEGNNMPLLDKDTNSAQLPNQDNIPLPAKKSIREQLASNPDSLKPEKKQKIFTEPRMNDTVRDIVTLWEYSGLHKSSHTTKIFKEGVKNIQLLMDGTLFQDGVLMEGMNRTDRRKYIVDEIKLSIKNFAKAALDSNYDPCGDYKKKLKSLPMAYFVHSPHSEKMKSLFIYYLKNEPKIITQSKGKLIEDKNPDMTRRLRDYYLNEVMRGIGIKLSAQDENHFIIASEKLLDFYDKNGDRMLKIGFRGERVDLVDWLCEALSEQVGGKNDYDAAKVAPSWFSSNITFNRVFPKYLISQNLYEGNNTILAGPCNVGNPFLKDSDDEDDSIFS